MSRLKPETAWQRIMIDTRLPARARIMALEQIARPSLCLPDKSGSQRLGATIPACMTAGPHSSFGSCKKGRRKCVSR